MTSIIKRFFGIVQSFTRQLYKDFELVQKIDRILI